MIKQDTLPQVENISIYRGDDHPIEIDVLNEDDSTFDITDCRFDLHASLKPNSEPVLKLSTETGEITIHENKLQILIGHELTASQTWHRSDYDLQMIDRHGMVKTLLKGTITLTGDVTQIETTQTQGERENGFTAQHQGTATA